MACGCRYHRSTALSTVQAQTDSSLLGLVLTSTYVSTIDAPFVPLAVVDTTATDALSSTINLPDSLAVSAQTTTATTSSALSSLLSGCRSQRFGPSCVFQVQQRVVLSGQLIGLAEPRGVVVFYTINGMPGASATDENGYYTLEAYPCEAVVITGTEIAGYTHAPTGYAFDPVCYSRPDLDFAYTASGS